MWAQLIDGSKVTIRSKRASGWDAFLTVMRTEEGVFVPCISTSGPEPVWTIHRAARIAMNGPAPAPAPASSASRDAKALRERDSVCFTFGFDDNRGGYRDFSADKLGHRRHNYPPHTNRRLVLSQTPCEVGPIADYLFMVDEKKEPSEVARTLRIGNRNVMVAMAEFYMDVLGECEAGLTCLLPLFRLGLFTDAFRSSERRSRRGGGHSADDGQRD